MSPDGAVLTDESRDDPGRPQEEFANRPEIDRAQLRDLFVGLASARGYSRLKLVFADGHEESDLDLVVGADGAWSKVRPSLSDTKPYYSGIGGPDCYIPGVDNRYDKLSKHVGQGMCLNLGEEKGMMCQRNSNSTMQHIS
ncbi:FAD/NAD(P)-binding domain-containing protein [Apiospora sp. TS-2023a]